MMRMPRRSLSTNGDKIISPVRAYSTMLRATSEMAVAIMVSSLPEKPNCSAKARPCCRALTISASDLMGIRRSADATGATLGLFVEVDEAFFQVQGCGHPLKRQSKLHHGKGHVRRNADDDGFSAAQFKHVSDRAQHAHGVRVHHIQG